MPTRWAGLGDISDAARRSFEARTGATLVATFAERDAEDLDNAIWRGEFDGVFVADIDTLLTGVFDGLIRLGEWSRRGVHIEFATPPRAESGMRVSSPGIADVLEAVARAHAEWSTRLRRRRTIAGTILSVIAIAVAAAVIRIARG